MIFQSYLSMLHIRIDVHHLCLASTAQFATDMADAENVEEMVGTREAEAAAVATVWRDGGDRVRRGGNNRRCDDW